VSWVLGASRLYIDRRRKNEVSDLHMRGRDGARRRHDGLIRTEKARMHCLRRVLAGACDDW